MTAERSDVLQGTLELLVLRTLALEPMHGWGLAQRERTVNAVNGVLNWAGGTK